VYAIGEPRTAVHTPGTGKTRYEPGGVVNENSFIYLKYASGDVVLYFMYLRDGGNGYVYVCVPLIVRFESVSLGVDSNSPTKTRNLTYYTAQGRASLLLLYDRVDRV
jgi:hypothetical protein